MALAQTPEDKAAPFHHIQAIPYTQLRGTPIHVDVLVPKILISSSPRPVILNLHGGGLVAGSRDFQPFWANWMLDEAVNQEAIIVTADYPLAPESKSPEILSGLRSLMDWLLSGALQKEISARLPDHKVQADVKKLLVVGESAGGWCALHLGLAYSRDIQALILRFPMIDLEAEFFNKPFGKQSIMGMPIPPPELVDRELQKLIPGSVVASTGPERFSLGVAMIGNGRVADVIGNQAETYPLRLLIKGAELPSKVWILHGQDDDTVPAVGSERTVALIKENLPKTDLRFDTRPGPHGFDAEWTLQANPFLEERLAWLRESWPR